MGKIKQFNKPKLTSPAMKAERDATMDRIFRAMAFPAAVSNDQMVIAGMTKFEYHSGNIFASLMEDAPKNMNDEELLLLARRASRAAQALMAAQNEAVIAIRKMEQEEAAKPQA